MTIEDKNWTMDPFDVLEVERTLNSLFGVWLKDRSVHVSASSDGKTAFVHVLIKNNKQTFYYPIEARADLQNIKHPAKDVSLVILDFIASYMEEFFKEDENVYLPIDWTDYHVEGLDFQVKGQVQNRHIEDMADQILQGATIPADKLDDIRLGEY